MNELPDIPRASAPDEIARALAGTTTPAPAREQETVQFNPWVPDERKLKYQPEDFDEQEIARGLVHPRDFVKIVAPARAPASVELHPLPPENPDPAEREFYRALQPLQKLFHPTASSASAPLRKSACGWDEPIDTPLARSTSASVPPQVPPADLTFRYRKSHGAVWKEGFDHDNVLKSAVIVSDPEELKKARATESETVDATEPSQDLLEEIIAGLDDRNEDQETESDFDVRIARELNAELVARGLRPIMSY